MKEKPLLLAAKIHGPQKDLLAPLRAQPFDARVQRALRLFQQHLDQPLRVRDLARSVLLSPSRFGYLVRRETASSPARLLKNLRFIEAQRILAASNLSVKEVAARVGMNDLSHFVRDFQSIFGLSPTRYRKRIQALKDLKQQQHPASADHKRTAQGCATNYLNNGEKTL